MAIRNDAGLLLAGFFYSFIYFFLEKEERITSSAWWRQGDTEKPGVFFHRG